MAENKFPTEVIELPSKGWFYPTESPLSKGELEIKYMTAKEEDILTSRNLLRKGIAIDMALRSLVVTPIDYDSLLIGDKNALMVACRVLAYGKEYPVDISCPSCGKKHHEIVDLTALEHKEVPTEESMRGVNEFEFELPHAKRKLTFKLLCGNDEKEIAQELESVKKMKKNSQVNEELSTRLKRMILSVDGKSDRKTIYEFVENEFLSIDSLSFRQHVRKVQPDVDLSFGFECPNEECGYSEELLIPLTSEFFWPTGRG